MITHRLSSLRIADRIVTVEAGRIAEDGTHDTLVKLGGRYAGLFRSQGGIHEVG